jgi:hypothetical protein
MDDEHVDPLRQSLDRLQRLRVDFDHLDDLATWLATVARLARDDLMTAATLAERATHVGRYAHAYGDDRIPEVPPLARRSDEIARQVLSGIAAVAAELEEQALLVHGIVHRHRDSEDRAVALLAELAMGRPPAAQAPPPVREAR